MKRHRLAACACAALFAGGGAALADTSVETFPEKFFAIDFPATPKITAGIYQAVTAGGTTVPVPAEIYSLQQPGAFYQVTVADLAGSAAEDRHALDHAIAAFRRRPDLALDTAVSHSLTGSRFQLCGRHFGYVGDSERLVYETLYYNPNTRKFYEVVSSVTPAAQSRHGADVQHFQTSLALQADAQSQLPAAPDYPENWKVYKYPQVGFDIRFPAEPTVEAGQYTTDHGITVPATRYWARQGDTLYRLTVANYWETDASPDGPGAEDAVDGAVRLWKKQGTVLSDDSVAISNGQCGRDVVLRTPDNLETRASIFFPATQHRIYIVEVTHSRARGTLDPLDDRRFRESLALATAQ